MRNMTKEEKAQEINQKLKELYPEAKIELNYSSPLELLVAVVLSAQATDKQVNIVTSDLFKKYKSIEDYVNTPLEEFEKDINHIGLYKGKAKNIKATTQIIHEKYNDKIPDTMEDLISLPGVGRKTANIILGNAYGKIVGIAVDTHVTRLSQLFGFTIKKDPVKIEKDLMQLIPQKDWLEFSKRLILYGRYQCTARCKHTDCALKEFIAS